MSCPSLPDPSAAYVLSLSALPALIRRPLPCRCFVCRLSGCHSAASLFSAGACQAVTWLPLCRQSAGFPLPRCRRRPILCLSYHAPRRPVKPPLAFRRRFPSREKPGAPSAGAYRKRSCGAFLATSPRGEHERVARRASPPRRGWRSKKSRSFDRDFFGAPSGTRTQDPLIKSQLLSQMTNTNAEATTATIRLLLFTHPTLP